MADYATPQPARRSEDLVDAQIEESIGVVMDRIDDLSTESDVDLYNVLDRNPVGNVRSMIFEIERVRAEHVHRAQAAEDLEHRVRGYLHDVANTGLPQAEPQPF